VIRLGMILALLAAQPVPVMAQPAPPETLPAATTTPGQMPARQLPTRRSQQLEQLPRMEAVQLLGSAQASTLAPRRVGEVAPVPNRDIEAPVNRRISMEASLMPEVFRRQMPGRGMTAEGVSNQREERVYAPAPGARLTVPFFTR
jgi:hypothetical protein